MKILLVEDHAAIRELTAAHLTARGFVVDVARTVAEASEALDIARYDALVVDLGLPDGDGAALIASRGRASRLTGDPPPPALILTARDDLEERVAGLDAGADDYVVKPFRVEELEARIRAVLRRPGARSHITLRMGSLSFDTVSRTASVDGKDLPLRRREALLLEALLTSSGRLVARDVLEQRLYSADEAVTPNALEKSASRLRRALTEAGADLRIETHRGVGYKITDAAP